MALDTTRVSLSSRAGGGSFGPNRRRRSAASRCERPPRVDASGPRGIRLERGSCGSSSSSSSSTMTRVRVPPAPARASPEDSAASSSESSEALSSGLSRPSRSSPARDPPRPAAPRGRPAPPAPRSRPDIPHCALQCAESQREFISLKESFDEPRRRVYPPSPTSPLTTLANLFSSSLARVSSTAATFSSLPTLASISPSFSSCGAMASSARRTLSANT